jgi:hypothetical protein
MNSIWEADPFLEEIKKSNSDLYIEYLNELTHEIESATGLCSYSETPTEIFEVITKKHPELRGMILAHPNCPQELITLAVDEIMITEDIKKMAKTKATKATKIRFSEKEAIRISYNDVINSPLRISGAVLASLWQQADKEEKIKITSRIDCPTDLLMDTWNLDYSDDTLVFDLLGTAIANIAAHSNIPKKLINELMRYDLNNVCGYEDRSLGQILLNNPAVPNEVKALIALQGISKQPDAVSDEKITGIHFWPSNCAYKYKKVNSKFREIFSALGHPESILKSSEIVTTNTYNAEIVLQYWASGISERIYECLWPELSNNSRVNFFCQHSNYDGNHTYVGVDGLDLSDDAFNNRLGYGNRQWIKEAILDFQDLKEEFATRTFYEFAEENWPDEVLISYTILEKLDEELYTLNTLGEKYILDSGNESFQEEATYRVSVIPNPSQDVWGVLDSKRQSIIMSIIEVALQSTNTKILKFATYLGVLIALNPATTKEFHDRLRNINNVLIKQALGE